MKKSQIRLSRIRIWRAKYISALLRGRYMLLIIAILAFFHVSVGQSFIEPLDNCGTLWFPKNHYCVIEDMNGKILRGEILTGAGVGSAPKWIKLRDSTGLEIRIDAELIKTMRVEASDIIKLSSSLENMGSIQEASTTDWNDIVDTEYLYYERALAPKKKKDKSRLYQLLNPGFDSKIKVYDDPYGEGGGLYSGNIGITGGQEKSYLVIVDSDKTIRIKKGDYKKQFVELFSGCEAIMGNFNLKKVKLKEFPLHVYFYDKVCSTSSSIN
jgi:hypothetical protein